MALLSSFFQVFIILGMYNFGHTAAAQRTSTLAWKPRIFLCEISERKRASWIWIDFSQQQIAKMNDVRRFSLQLKLSKCYLVGMYLTRQLIYIFLWEIWLSFIYTLYLHFTFIHCNGKSFFWKYCVMQLFNEFKDTKL